MPKIDSTKFGSITINGIKYSQILIIGNKVIQRDEKALREEFGTTHYISEKEQKKLLSKNPEIIIIGTGTQGVLKTFPEFDKIIKKLRIELIKLKTAQAIKKYNKLREVKRINALIHTTC